MLRKNKIKLGEQNIKSKNNDDDSDDGDDDNE